MKVVNKHFHKPTPFDLYVARPSPLGNPYSSLPNTVAKYIVKEGQAIPMYRKWLEQKIESRDEKVMAELAKITPETNLVCWCAPHRPCHAEVIMDLVVKHFLPGQLKSEMPKRFILEATPEQLERLSYKNPEPTYEVREEVSFYQDLMDLSVHIDQSAS